MNISISRTSHPKVKPDTVNLGFGKYLTDHMFMQEYSNNQWQNPRIIPYGPIILDPAASVLNYGQETFEGLKAFKNRNGGINLFRPEKNMERMNQSNSRMCMPELDIRDSIEAIKALVNLDRDWIPDPDGTALYIRPITIATDPFLGVHASDTYLFYIILSPVGSYYKSGMKPTSIYVENDYVRAVRGGMGFAKTGGNYACGIKAQEEACKKGFNQVLWLDAIERKFIEEVGTSNVFFVMKDEVITPSLNGSILPGITRDSVITLFHSVGIRVTERKISIDEVFAACKENRIKEAFATGTAAVVSPIGKLCWNDQNAVINNGETGPIAQNLYNTLTGIQKGDIEDDFEWITVI